MVVIFRDCIIKLLGHCKGINFNISYLGMVRLFHLLNRGYWVLFIIGKKS